MLACAPCGRETKALVQARIAGVWTPWCCGSCFGPELRKLAGAEKPDGLEHSVRLPLELRPAGEA